MAEELSYDAIDLEARYGPWKYPLADRIARHLEAIENAHPWHRERSPWGPPVAPPTILGNMAVRFLDQAGPVPPGTLHARSEIEIAAALRLDRQPVGYGKFTDKYEKRGRKWFVFETRWRDETGLILGRASVTMALPGGGETSDTRQETRGEEAERKPDLPAITRELTADKLTAYSEDSANALRGQSIHVQEDAAKRAGFPAPVAQGLMAADYIGEILENALEKQWYENSKLSVVFLRPMLAGDTIAAAARLAEAPEEGGVVRRVYEVWATNQRGETTVAGQATSLVRREAAAKA